jgi:hypothetical protein
MEKRMTSKRVRDFLRAVQGIVQELETTLVDTLASVAPWLGPIAPAYLAYKAMVGVLGLPVWVAFVIAAVIELLGISTINTAVQFWNYNQTKRQSDPRAPFWMAVIMAVFYLTVVLVVNVLLDNADLVQKTAKFLLSALSPVAAVTLSLRAQHTRRVLNVTDRKAQEKVERAERKSRKVTEKVTEEEVEPVKVTETTPLFRDWRKVPEAERLKIFEMRNDIHLVMSTYKVSERTGYNWIANAEAEFGGAVVAEELEKTGEQWEAEGD